MYILDSSKVRPISQYMLVLHETLFKHNVAMDITSSHSYLHIWCVLPVLRAKMSAPRSQLWWMLPQTAHPSRQRRMYKLPDSKPTILPLTKRTNYPLTIHHQTPANNISLPAWSTLVCQSFRQISNVNPIWQLRHKTQFFSQHVCDYNTVFFVSCLCNCKLSGPRFDTEKKTYTHTLIPRFSCASSINSNPKSHT